MIHLNGWTGVELESGLDRAQSAYALWSGTTVTQRANRLQDLKKVITDNRSDLAKLITLEMGKLHVESLAEVDKCLGLCDYYHAHADAFLREERVTTDAAYSYLLYQPLGAVLAIMPWNFPLWQVLRCAVPTITAGNVCLLKHAANVPQLAAAIERLFIDAGYPPGVFTHLPIAASQVAAVIGDRRVRAVSFTGSEAAGRQIASVAGGALKKCVLELGGSDPFVVLADADLAQAAHQARVSRFLNCGQSCIAAKRLIVVATVADRFCELLLQETATLRTGDPLLATTTLAPLARSDLRAQLHAQVQAAVAHGARLLCGGDLVAGAGYHYQPTLLDAVSADSPAAREEVFGPVAAILRAGDEAEALRLANASRYGLGASVWTRDADKGRRFAQGLDCGMAFINAVVKSDARVPFGGIKDSGYGRELSRYGMLEFVNIKTVWQQ